MRKIYLLCFPALLISGAGVSQDSTSVTTLKEVVISASRAERPVIEIPRSVTPIGEDEIKSSVYQSVGELLNARSGLYVVGANQTPGTNQGIFMRGTNSNQVAVLIDGVRITDPSSPNAAIDLSEVSLANIDRIEVIRGSHSTIFGGSAVGGVINLITKKSAQAGLHGDVSWQGGVFGRKTWSSIENVDLTYGTVTGLYFNGSLFRYDAGGLDASEKVANPASFTADRDDFKKTDGSFKAGFKNEKWNVSLAFKNSYQYTEIDDGAYKDDENSILKFDRKLYQYSAGYSINPYLRLSAVGSLSNSERFYEDDSSRVSPTTWDHVFATGTYHGRLQTHEMQLNYNRAKVQALIGGGLYREKMFFDNYILLNDPQFPFEIVTNYDSLDTRTTTGYLFGQLAYSLGRMNLSAGARASRHTTAGNFFTFEFNPSYLIGDFLLYGSLSTGFNAPSLYQLYDPNKDFGSYTTRGNSGLKPEQSVSAEAGVKKQFLKGSYFTLSAYHTRITNSIEYVYLWNGSKEIEALDFSDSRGDTYINVGEQLVQGIEVEGRLRLTDALSLQGNISLLRAQISVSPSDIKASETGENHVQLYNLGRFVDGDFEQNDVVRRPRGTMFAGVDWDINPVVSLSATYRHTANRFDAGYDGALGPYGALARIEVDNYNLLDAGASWKATDVLSLSLKVENILDEDYREVVGFQTRGRSVYLKIAARF